MDWSNERYVRLYCRVTVDESLWPFESQALWPQIIRLSDRAGVIDLGKHEPAKAVAALLRWPLPFVSAGLDGLIADGCVVVNGTQLAVRNYIPAQETPASDAQRSRESRANKALRHGASQAVTKRDATDTKRDGTITVGHGVSQSVTPSVPSVPSFSAEEEQQPPHEIKEAKLNQQAVTAHDVSIMWHTRAQAVTGLPVLHALYSWERDYSTVASACNGHGSHAVAVLRAVMAYFWHAPTGPIASGRVKAPGAKPSMLAKNITSDIDAAHEWWTREGKAMYGE